MGQKILIIGGVAGGASAATKLRRNSEKDTIIMLERGPHVSFSNCALPYHLSGIVDEAEKLVLMNPKAFLKQYNIEARVNEEAVRIDRKRKCVVIKELVSGKVYEEFYDKVILSPGASPIIPSIKGIEKADVFTIRNVVDIDTLNRFIKEKAVEEIVVIGGGFIGVEAAENLSMAGYHVTLVEGSRQILNTYDYDMVQILQKEMMDKGVTVIVEDTVTEFNEYETILASGKVIATDAVVMAAGVRPETGLAKEAGLLLGTTGAIKTNAYYQTNDPDIYAIGDAIEVDFIPTKLKTKLSLAGPAVKQARAVADHIHNKNNVPIEKGYIGASAIKVFDYNGASVGINEAMIKRLNLDLKYEIVRVILPDKVGLMPDAQTMHLKLLFEIPTGKILGAQAIGKGDVTKRVDVISTAMKFSGTVSDLMNLELCYAPPFSTPKDIVNYAGYVGSNLLNGMFKQVNVDTVRGLVEKKRFILDVREKAEYKRGYIKNAVNIPLSELRERLSEIPKEENIYLYCRTGQRSYHAALTLQNSGYENVYNIAGSFLGIYYYDYYNDKTKKQESIIIK